MKTPELFNATKTFTTALRQGRLQAMASLCDLNESNVDNLNLVPDGATYHALPAGVVDMGPAPMALDDAARSGGACSSPEPNTENGTSSPGDWVGKGCSSSSPTCAAPSPATVPSDSELPQAASLQRPRSCYVCKVKFWRLHHFYDSLCPECASLNYEKRFQQPKLNSSYIYLVTGGRVKIGFHTAVKLLNAGATVLVTSRFRNDCLERFVNFYGRERFFAKEWEEVVNVESLGGVPAGGPAQVVRRQTSIADRLVLLGVDLRFLPRVEQLCDYVVANYPHLDGVIHNACQTIRRPHMYYEPLREKERAIGYGAGVLGIEDGGRQICPQQGVFYDYGLKLNNNKPLSSTTSIDQSDVHRQNTPSTSTGATSPASSTPDSKQLHHFQEEVEHRNCPYPAQQSSQTLQTQSESDHVLHLTTTDDAAIKIGSRDLPGYTDVNGQLIDYREKHSWVYKLQDVETPELVECFLINAMAPFVMNGRLKNLLERAPARGRTTPSSTTSSSPPAENKMKKMAAAGVVSAVRRSFIVNVSAMEGKFYRYKTPNHPHTNMAKASLNMMTKTSARDYAEHSSIFMNSVDTGWINDEKPVKQAFEHAKTRNWQTPIDEIDAAARILDPIFSWVVGADGRVLAEDSSLENGSTSATAGSKTEKQTAPPFGMFLKDYRETEW